MHSMFVENMMIVKSSVYSIVSPQSMFILISGKFYRDLFRHRSILFACFKVNTTLSAHRCCFFGCVRGSLNIYTVQFTSLT